MFFVCCAAVDAVDTEQFELVFAVQSDKVIMDEAFLWHLIII